MVRIFLVRVSEVVHGWTRMCTCVSDAIGATDRPRLYAGTDMQTQMAYHETGR